MTCMVVYLHYFIAVNLKKIHYYCC